jgi:hypothetical protein
MNNGNAAGKVTLRCYFVLADYVAWRMMGCGTKGELALKI